MKNRDILTVLRMWRKLLKTEADHPPEVDRENEVAAHSYLAGRREGIYVAINAINEATGDDK